MNRTPPLRLPLKLLVAVGGALVCVTHMDAQGATISIAPSYVQSFDSALGPLGSLPNDGAATPVGGYLQYEFRLALDGPEFGEDFWTAIFDVQLSPGLEIFSPWLDPGTAQLEGLYPDAPSLAAYDSNGATAGGMQFHWQYGNEDFGLDSNDLESIIVEAAPGEAANRQYGEIERPGAGSPDGLDSPTLIGTIIVRRSELTISAVSVVPIDGSPWGVYVGNSVGEGMPLPQSGGAFSGGTAVLVVPEPGTFALALFGMIALFVTRWRIT